jgi:hypothetical protein
MTDNPYISFLSTYAPFADSDALSDENVLRSQEDHGIRLGEAPAPFLSDVADAILTESPLNVVLTGTAGDGKTFHIRKFLVEHLGGLPPEWPGKSGVIEVPLQGGKTLRVLRDLTEIKDENKTSEVQLVTRSLLDDEPSTVYLLAANNGQLLKFWRDAMEGAPGGSAERARYQKVHTRLAEMLHLDQTRDATGEVRIKLLNLSQTQPEAVFDRLFDAILEHEQWQVGCSHCPLAAEGAPQCPIRYNRDLLQGSPGATPFRDRLKQTLRLSAMNDQHVPIRQMLMIVVNALLGDHRRSDRSLTCKEARRRARDGDYRSTNPYDSALGLNVRPEKRRALAVFSSLSTFGVGLETNNAIDALLIERQPEALAASLDAADPIYGKGIFEGLRDSYQRGDDTIGNGQSFSAALETQRRRLFFLLDGSSPEPWNLTVFREAGLYLAFSEAVATGKDPEVVATVTGQLVNGLNRTLAGMMTGDTDALWLARSIGRSDPSVGCFTMLPEIKRKGFSEFRVEVASRPGSRRPQLFVANRRTGERSTPLELRPLLFEYLVRVAKGSLPSSFSRQCYQEVRHFALAAASFVERYMEREDDQLIRILSVAKSGAITPRDIGA